MGCVENGELGFPHLFKLETSQKMSAGIGVDVGTADMTPPAAT